MIFFGAKVVENDLEVFSVRLPRGLGEAVKQIAKESRRSRNGQIVLLIEQAVDLHKIRATKEQKEKMGTLQAGT